MSAARAKSDDHPAVVNYRQRLESAAQFGDAQIHRLQKKVAETVRVVRTPVPPPPDDEAVAFEAQEAPTTKNGILSQIPAKPPRP